MNARDEDLTAYCGLYCGDCIRYRAKAADLADELGAELDRIKFDKYAQVKAASAHEWGHFKEFLFLLKALSNLRCETPCRLGGNGCAQPCKIKMCVRSKQIQGCWECSEFERCENFEFLKPFHGEAPQENLRKIRKYGLDGWARHREKCYPWL